MMSNTPLRTRIKSKLMLTVAACLLALLLHTGNVESVNDNKLRRHLKGDDKKTTTRTTATSSNEVQLLKKKKDDGGLDILVLGGGSTFGTTLPGKELISYPSLLGMPNNRVKNASVRSAGAGYASQCIETLISDEHYDVIVLEFSLSGHKGLELLIKRLRTRFPDAIIVYVHLYSFRMDVEDKDNLSPNRSGKPLSEAIVDHWGAGEKRSDLIFKEIFAIVRKYDGHMYSLPRTAYPWNSSALFFLDWHHLSVEGHRRVAADLMKIIKDARGRYDRKKARKGTWGNGDKCTSWFIDAAIPVRFTGEAQRVGFAGYARTLNIAIQFRGEGSLFVDNDRPFTVPIYLMILTKGKNYPKVEVEVDGRTIVVDPAIEFPRSAMKTVLVGWAKPGTNEIKINPITGWLTAFRVTGINLCGACVELADGPQTIFKSCVHECNNVKQ